MMVYKSVLAGLGLLSLASSSLIDLNVDLDLDLGLSLGGEKCTHVAERKEWFGVPKYGESLLA